MGSDPTTAVVNKFYQSFDVQNLFIVAASNFPQRLSPRSNANRQPPVTSSSTVRRERCNACASTDPWGEENTCVHRPT